MWNCDTAAANDNKENWEIMACFSIKKFLCILDIALEKRNELISTTFTLKWFLSIFEKPLDDKDLEVFLIEYALK